MAVGKKYFDSTNLLHLTVALSMLRPDLQGFLGQNTTPPMPVITYPQNYTGVAFTPSSTSSNFNFHLGPKEAVGQNSNPLSEFLDWHTTNPNQLDTDAVAMLFNGESHAPKETRTSFSTELDSGYCSDGGRSPSALSSVSGSPPHDRESSFGNFEAPEDFNNAGATAASGFTIADHDLLGEFELEDYIDLDSIYDEPPQKKAFSPQPFYPNVKTEPLSPVDGYTRKVSNSPLDTYVPTDFNRKDPFEAITLQEPFSFDGFDQLDPYSIDFSATNEELQQSGTQGDTAFDFESFANNLDYSTGLPLDIFDPRPVVETTVESKHDSLLPLGQEPLPVFSEATATRNDSGGSFTESSLTQSFSGDWEGAPLPLLSSVAVKQEKDFPDQPTGTSTRFTPAKVPRDVYNDARPQVASSSASQITSEDEIVDMNISEFNTFLETLSEAEGQKARDIRRRGKNKVAARLCRKRKIELVADIEEDIDSLKQKKEDILKERKKLQAENSFYKNKISELQDRLFKSLQDESGRPLSAKEYSLFQGANGSIYVGKNIDSESRKKQSGDTE